MTASPEFTPLRIIRIPHEDGVPNIPDMLDGMQLARKKGHDLFILALEEIPDHISVVGYFSIEERNTPARWDWRLSYLYVLPSRRREGIAFEVLRVIKREFGVLTASVPEDNLAGQLLLKKSGFRCERVVTREGKSWYVFRYPVESGEGRASP